MGIINDRLFDGPDSEFTHSKRPSLSYIVRPRDEMAAEALREVERRAARVEEVPESVRAAEGRGRSG